LATDTETTRNARGQTDGVVIKDNIKGNIDPNQGKRPRKETKEAYAALQRELAARINHLKAEGRETCESWVANLEGDVSTLVEFLDGSSEVRKSRDLKAATLGEWRRILDDLSLKPPKGRRKDLRRIDQAVRAMMRSAFD
jgi:hypothetical protein